MRMLILGALALALAAAFLLYGINYDTRLLEDRVEAQEREIDKARGDIAVFKAERAHLAAPIGSSRSPAPKAWPPQPSSSSSPRPRMRSNASLVPRAPPLPSSVTRGTEMAVTITRPRAPLPPASAPRRPPNGPLELSSR